MDHSTIPPLLSDLSLLLDQIGERYAQVIHQTKTFSISLSQHLFTLFQQLCTLCNTDQASGESKKGISPSVHDDKAIIELVEHLKTGAVLLLDLINGDPRVERAGDKQYQYIFERETEEQIEQIKHAIATIRTAADAVNVSQWKHYTGSSEDLMPITKDEGSKNDNKKNDNKKNDNKKNKNKKGSDAPRHLEIHANVIAEDNLTGIQRPEEHCFQPYTFHLLGNESLCGREMQLRKTMYQLNHGPQSALRVVMCVGSLGIGKTHFATRISRSIVRELDADQAFFVRCRGNQEYPQTTLEIMQQVIKLWNVGAMPSKPEELCKLYYKSFIGRRTVLLLDDPVDARQILELLPRFESKSNSRCVVVVASRNALAIETFTRGQVDAVDEKNQIVEMKSAEEGHDVDYDSDDFSEDYHGNNYDDDDDDDGYEVEDEEELQPEEGKEHGDESVKISMQRQKERELKKEMAQIFGAHKRKVVTVALHKDNDQSGKTIKHPKNFNAIIVKLEKLDMDEGASILVSAHPGITVAEGRPLALLCENIPVFLKVAARTHLLFLSSSMSFDEFTSYISETIDSARDQGFSHLKTLCHGYFIGCYHKWDTLLQKVLLGMTIFPASVDIVSCSRVLDVPLAQILMAMTELSRMGLVNVETHPQRYSLHDLVRETFSRYVQENEYDLDEQLMTVLDQSRNRFTKWYLSQMTVFDREHEFGGIGAMPGPERYDLDLENTKVMMDIMQESETDHILAINAMRYLLRDRTFPITRGVLYQRLVQHADELESDFDKAIFLEGFAQVYKQLTDYDQAYKKCKQALDIMNNAVVLSDRDEDELETLPILKQLGDLASTTRSYDYARDNYEKIIQLVTKHAKEWQRIVVDKHSLENTYLDQISGFDNEDVIVVDPFLAHALTQMAVIHVMEGDFQKGHKCFEQGVTVMKRIFGRVHPALSEAYASYANVLKAFKGKAMSGEINQLFEDALDVDHLLYGETSFVQVQRMEDYGVGLLAQGKYVQAEEIFQRTIEMRKQQYGEHDITVSAGMNNLAVALKNLGKLEAAEDLYEQCLIILSETLGEDHPQTAVTKSNLATLRSMMGKGASAEQLYEEAMGNLVKDHGDGANNGNNDEVRAAMLNQMGDTMRQQEEYEQAIKYYEQALELRRQISRDPENDPEIAKIVSSVGKLYFDRAEFAEAERLQEEAAQIMSKQVGKEHSQYISCIMALGNTKFRLNKPKDAEELFREVYDIKKNKLGEGEIPLLAVKQSIAVCIDMQKRYQESEQEYRELLQHIEEFNAGDEKLRIVLLSLATNMSRQQKFDEAEQFYKRAEDLVLKAFGEDSLPYGNLMADMAAVFLNKENYDNAERCFSKALVILEEQLGPDADRTAMVQENLNELRNLIYQRDRAKRCCVMM